MLAQNFPKLYVHLLNRTEISQRPTGENLSEIWKTFNFLMFTNMISNIIITNTIRFIF